MAFAFEALYYADRLHLVNPYGDVGILTLWSPFPAVRRKLEAIAPEILDPRESRVAVVANLYGDGLYAMLCNLLYNPQIRHLIAIGEDLGQPTSDEIRAFLAAPLDDHSLFGGRRKRIHGTARTLPVHPGFDDALLRNRLTFRRLGGGLSDPALASELKAWLSAAPGGGDAGERVRVDIWESVGDYEYRPSEPAAHQVVRRRPLDCWEELVVRTMRFGTPVELGDGPRLELPNAKALILEPVEESAVLLAEYEFDLDAFHDYQAKVLDPAPPVDGTYTYGNRLRGYFRQEEGVDTLATVVKKLRADRESRTAYVSLWDSAVDLPGRDAHPCLTTIFFRCRMGRLHLTATYRAHNLLDAWLENVYGLMAIQRHVSDRVRIPPGTITVVSHFLGIDPRNTRYDHAKRIAVSWKRDADFDRETGKYSLREDPNGHFSVYVDAQAGAIVAEHWAEGALIKRYEATRAEQIEREIVADMAVSLPSHALWLGRELARNEHLLRASRSRRSEARAHEA